MPILPFLLPGSLGAGTLRAAPTASFTAAPPFGVIGSVIRLDASQSKDPGEFPLTYLWTFIDGKVPIGSKIVREGFRNIEPDGSVVTFSPDKVGEYVVQLIVYN